MTPMNLNEAETRNLWDALFDRVTLLTIACILIVPALLAAGLSLVWAMVRP